MLFVHLPAFSGVFIHSQHHKVFGGDCTEGVGFRCGFFTTDSSLGNHCSDFRAIDDMVIASAVVFGNAK